MKILVVCLGNICRSPLAEGLFRREITRRKLDWEVDSAGTAGYHIGKSPDTRSQAVARAQGIDISHQCSRRVSAADLQAFDVVFAMDRQNLQDLQQLASPATQPKIQLLLEYADLARNEGPDVFDPYYDSDAFQRVYQQLERATTRAVARLARQ